MSEKAVLTIDWELLSELSYQTKLGKSLKNTLRKFNKSELFEELDEMIRYFTEKACEQVLPSKNRIKSLQSCCMKYNKYFPSTEVEKVFNDILGIRIIPEDYSIVDSIEFPEKTRIADMRNGKINDDGYRGIHVYFQKDHFHYPIEVQFMTERDRQFNEWLHVYLYKYTKDNTIGIALRKKYDEGLIVCEEQFRKEMENYVLISSKKI